MVSSFLINQFCTQNDRNSPHVASRHSICFLHQLLRCKHVVTNEVVCRSYRENIAKHLAKIRSHERPAWHFTKTAFPTKKAFIVHGHEPDVTLYHPSSFHSPWTWIRSHCAPSLVHGHEPDINEYHPSSFRISWTWTRCHWVPSLVLPYCIPWTWSRCHWVPSLVLP